MNPTPRVLHVGNFLSAKRTSRQLIEELADQLQAAGWKLYRTSSILSRPLRLCAMLGNVALRRDYDVVHIAVFSGPAFVWTAASVMTARLRRRPIVLSLHGGNLPTFSRRWPRLVSNVLKSAAAVVAPSTYLRDAFIGVRSDIAVFPNPVAVGRYSFVPRQPAAPRLLWMRGFGALYNPELALRVVALLAPRFPDLTLEMVGRDLGQGTLAACQALAHELGITERVRFSPQVPKTEVPSVLARADVLLNTPHIDNTPTSLVEAMACGLCVVTTDVGGIPHLVADGVDALIVPSDDAEAMAGAVTRVLSDPALAHRLSTAGRAKAEGFDWAAVLPRWQQLFRNCAAPTMMHERLSRAAGERL